MIVGLNVTEPSAFLIHCLLSEPFLGGIHCATEVSPTFVLGQVIRSSTICSQDSSLF